MSEILTVINSAIGAFIGVIGIYRMFKQEVENLSIQITKIQTELDWIKKEFEEKKQHYERLQEKIYDNLGGKK